MKQSSFLDHPGIIARDVADAAFIVEAIGGEDIGDEQTLGSSPFGLLEAALGDGGSPRFAFVRRPYWQRADPETRAAFEAFALGLDALVDIVDLPAVFEEAAAILTIVMDAGIAHAYSDDFAAAGPLMADARVRIIEHGKGIAATDFVDALAARNSLRRSFDALVASYDAILTPATCGVAPLVSEGTGDPIFATAWTLIGAPAITLPLLRSAAGLPLGVQIVGETRQDAGLLKAAAWLEHARGHLSWPGAHQPVPTPPKIAANHNSRHQCGKRVSSLAL